MILLLDTSTPICRLGLSTDGSRKVAWSEWQADRQLANGLLAFIIKTLQRHNADFSDITAIAVFCGPGSFTGLRIGITVANTLADGLGIAIVGEQGDAWVGQALRRIKSGQTDRIVIPYYGAEAHITKPRK